MSDMAIESAYVLHRIDVDEFHRMAAAGVFASDAHIELIDGELIERVGPIRPPHAGTVTKIASYLRDAFRTHAHVRSQQPVTLGPASETQPDVALVAFDRDGYMQRHPSRADIHLLIEVSDSTRDIDRRKKIPLYARAGVPEVWLVDLIDDSVLMYRRPEAGTYSDVRRAVRGERLYTSAFEMEIFEVADFLPHHR